MSRPSLALVVKYYPPTRRISGIIGYLTVLARHLAQHVDLEVISYRTDRPEPARYEHDDGYRVSRVGFPFPVTSARRVNRLDPDHLIVVSGVYSQRLAGPYFGALETALRWEGPRRFYQVTNVDGPPSRLLTRLVNRYAELLCASHEISAAFEPVTRVPMSVLAPAIDVERLRDVIPEPTPPGRFRVGFLNHFTRIKGADLALASFARLSRELPEAEFIAAGTGELEDEVRDTYGGHDRIRIVGYLPEPERLALLASFDVLVLPFRTEVSVLGLSQTVLEAMALGVVVVGSPVPVIANAIRDGVDGVLAATSEELDAAVLRLARDPAEADALGRAAAERARHDFDVATRVDEIRSLLGV